MKKNVVLCLIAVLCSGIAGCSYGEMQVGMPDVIEPAETEIETEQKSQDDIVVIEKETGDNQKAAEEQPAKTTTEKKPNVSSRNLLDEMDASQRKEVNIFLSNFSEAPFSGDFSASNKVFFAYRHNIINNKKFDDKIYEYDGESYMGISEELANKTIERFFGDKVDANDVLDGFWMYKDGKFLFPAADGDQYGYNFTIAKKVTKLEDGTYSVDFNIYMVDDEYSWPTSDCYYYTIEQANQKCILNYSGSAVIRPKKYNGSDTYELLSYNINY